MDYLPRLVDPLLDRLASQLPALSITGPRATGKTTTATRLAASIVRLDREAEAAAFRADPDAALRGMAEPVLLDEWQVVPGVLGAVKRAVDADPRPGRFIVTGSARSDLDGETWPGTGRLTRVAMTGMTVREQLRRLPGTPFLDRVAAGAIPQPAATSPDLRGYLELALCSGFPEAALALGEEARHHWLESYVDHLVTRDAAQVESGRDPARLRRYLEAYALNTAGVVEEQTLLGAAGINRRTAQAYERLLGSLLVVESLPAWASNRLKRLVLTPKRHLVDPALVVGVLRLDVGHVLRDGDLMGRLLESFVVAQLRAELPVAQTRPRLFHLRQHQGRIEVDVVADLAGGGIVGIEVKATAAPGPSDARHLATLRDAEPERFVAGIVLHTGPRSFPLGERLWAAPISSLWGPDTA